MTTVIVTQLQATYQGCGLSARKAGNYKYDPKTKRKRRRHVPAHRQDDLQGDGPLQ